mmetsp:Transcript_68466/g.135297  ORF Transcript_68466/g.135297 Transcript_68466/m.135297 type:complete len:131 (-) Transcript_68466:215-607(-)
MGGCTSTGGAMTGSGNSGAVMHRMGSGKPPREGFYLGRSNNFTRELDHRCTQETNLAIELSRQAAANDMTWATLESERRALDDEYVAEALALSYEQTVPQARSPSSSRGHSGPRASPASGILGAGLGGFW